MSKKREQIRRRRQLNKTRQGAVQRSARSGPAPRPKEVEKKTAKGDIWLAVGIVVLILALFVGLYYLAVVRPKRNALAVETAAPGQTQAKSWAEPPAMTLDLSKTYEAVVTTEKGTFRIHLFDDQAPNTVNNFVFLARQGFYDGVIFHRVISGFMAQTGDPTGTGSGGPGYTFADEFSPELRHDREGIVSMANSGVNTNGSQFFITYAPQPHLNDKHSVFGEVTEGMDVVRALTPRDPADPNAPPGDRILTIDIIEQ